MIKIISLTITPFEQNFRLVIDSQSKSILIVDPGGEVDRIMDVIDRHLPKEGISEAKLLLTHSHIDHGGGVKAMLKQFESKYGMKPTLLFHRDNDLYRETIERQSMMYGMTSGEYENVPASDNYLEDGESFDFGMTKVQSLFTPGHAPGHLSFFCARGEFELIVEDEMLGSFVNTKHSGPLLIAGDALFKGSIGRTDLPGGNHEELLRSIRTKLLVLPDETIVLAGHGPNTHIGLEKSANPFLIE